MRFIFICLIVFATSCSRSNDNSDNDHSHEKSYPTLDYTLWTSQSEMFVEFPVMVVGESVSFTAHFTKMNGHRPVTNGSVTISLIKDDAGIRSTSPSPDSPGIFKPVLKPTREGLHRLIFELSTPEYSDKFIIDSIMVYNNQKEALSLSKDESDSGSKISFLKEQAWKSEFQTTPVVKREVFNMINSSGRWKSPASGYEVLIAPSDGRVSFANELLTEGARINKGQLLFIIKGKGLTKDNIDTELQNAKAVYEQAKLEYERKQKLYQSKIIPKSEFESVEQRFYIAKTNYENLDYGYSDGGKEVRAPFAGYIKFLKSSNGSFVEQGSELVTLVSDSKHMLEVQVSPEYYSQLNAIQNIYYQPAPGIWSSTSNTGGKVLSVAKAVNQEQPMLLVYVMVKDAVQMPEGSFTEVQIATGVGEQVNAIPVSAILEDYGTYSVMVQRSGESFERRNITTGRRSGEYVEIIDGLEEGEYVVTKGAYQVKMAALSGQAPAHGHSH